jgi:hypothetical protein
MMSDYDTTLQSIRELAGGLAHINRLAAQQYRPVVDGILREGSTDVRRIEETLDGMLGFCGDDAVLLMYRQLCRHYWTIDPAATASYVRAYREQWDPGDLHTGDEQMTIAWQGHADEATDEETEE